VQSAFAERNHVIESLGAPIHVFAAVGARFSVCLGEHSAQELDGQCPVRLVDRVLEAFAGVFSAGLAPSNVNARATGLTDNPITERLVQRLGSGVF
jgi:hypothetical protein